MMTNRTSQTIPPGGSSIDPEMDEDSTGMPAFNTWRSLYVFVIVVFVICVILLKVFELVFS